MKLIGVLGTCLMAAAPAFAGGLVSNTNQSAAFMRNPARGTTIDPDAAYYNPAGAAFMKEGLHFGFNNQMAFQRRNVTATIAPNDYLPEESMSEREYKGKIFAPVIPSIDFVYSKKNWAVSSHFGFTGGGGTLKYADGLPMFDAMVRMALFQQVAQAAGDLGAARQAASMASVNSQFTGKSFLIGWQFNGSYKLSENLSVSAGIRLNRYLAGYEGSVGFSVPSIIPETEYKLDCKQTGFAVQPMLGVNYRGEKFSLSATYDFAAKITAKSKTAEFPEAFANVAALASYQDGSRVRADQPAMATLNADYCFGGKFTLSGGFKYYFDKDADYNGAQKLIDRNSMEIVAGGELKLNERWLVSLGLQKTLYGVTDNYTQNTSFIMDSWSLTGGFRYKITNSLAVDLACMTSLFEDYNKTAMYGTLPVGEHYVRKSCVPALGIIWDL